MRTEHDTRRSRGSGAPDRIRTCDLRLRRPTLYPLSYRRAIIGKRGRCGPEAWYTRDGRGVTIDPDAGLVHATDQGWFTPRTKSKAPAEAGALIAAGFANRKGIFHARFPVLP